MAVGKSIKIWVLILTAVLLLPRLLLPGLAEDAISRTFEQELGGVTEVQIRTQFGWELLLGKAASISITGSNWDFQGLPIEAFHFKSEGMRIDLTSLIRSSELVVLGADQLRVELVLSEAGLNQYFWDRIDPKRLFSIDLLEDRAALHGTVELWQTSWNVSLLSEFSIHEPALIQITPVEFLILDTRVPSMLLELISERYSLQLNLGDLPVPIRLDEIKIRDDRIVFYGSGA